MTTITILPETNNSYRARAGDKESTGRTAGEALDALASQLPDEVAGALVIVQNYKPDHFFNAAQQKRLTKLMQRRKTGRLSLEEEIELESLVEAELDGARLRLEQKLLPGKEAIPERGLSASHRDLIAMGLFMGSSQQEIAAAINKSVTVVKHEIAKIRAEVLDRLMRAEMRERSTQTSQRRKVVDDSAQVSRLDELEP